MKLALLVPLVALAGFAGCSRPVPPVVQTKPPEVTVELPKVMNVTDYEVFTGRTVASKAVIIKARVTGELMKIHFTDGDEVKEGDPLFDIDPKTYKADYELAKANVLQAEAKSLRSNLEYERQQLLKKTNSLSKEEEDRNASERAEAAAAVKVANRQVEVAENYVKYSHIKSPINGRISRRLIDEGNLVKADETLLTTIVATDVLYADFDVDDRTLLKLNEIRAKETKSAKAAEIKVRIGLPNRDDFTGEGTIIFEDNQVNPGTGTKMIRAKMDNADKVLDPGLFVRVRLNIGAEKRSILVPEVAIGTDQGLKYVYVVNELNKVEYRRVKLGLPQQALTQESLGALFGSAPYKALPLEEGSLRVVEPLENEPNSGVRETDRVIVKGLQRVREKAEVIPSFEKPATVAPGKVASASTGG